MKRTYYTVEQKFKDKGRMLQLHSFLPTPFIMRNRGEYHLQSDIDYADAWIDRQIPKFNMDDVNYYGFMRRQEIELMWNGRDTTRMIKY